MYENFSSHAKSTIVYAADEAHNWKTGSIDTEHLLLGLDKLHNSVAQQAVTACNVTWYVIVREIQGQMKVGDTLSANLELTHRAAQVIRYAKNEAQNMGHNYVGAEHILLGIMRRDDKGIAALTLAKLGLKIEAVREEVLRHLGIISKRVQMHTISGTDPSKIQSRVCEWLQKNKGKYEEVCGPVTFSSPGYYSVTFYYIYV